MGQFKLASLIEEGKKSSDYTYENASAEDVANAVEQLFKKHGYKIEQGNKMEGVYGIGSKVMRVLFGAFAKRYVFGIAIEQVGADTRLTFKKGMTGMMGGAIGYAKMNSETERWKIRFKEL